MQHTMDDPPRETHNLLVPLRAITSSQQDAHQSKVFAPRGGRSVASLLAAPGSAEATNLRQVRGGGGHLVRRFARSSGGCVFPLCLFAFASVLEENDDTEGINGQVECRV